MSLDRTITGGSQVWAQPMPDSSANVIHPDVRIGRGTVIEPPCIIGKPARGDAGTTVIGEDCVIRPFTTIYAGAVLGNRVQTGQGVTIREDNVVGDGSSVGTNAVLEPGNRIGRNCRVHTGCFLELVTLQDDVFLGPNVAFADDPHPPCPRYEDCMGGAFVGTGSSIGANATILPGVHIGKGSLIGAGSVVTRDVREGMVTAGSPSSERKCVNELQCKAGHFERPYAWREAE